MRARIDHILKPVEWRLAHPEPIHLENVKKLQYKTGLSGDQAVDIYVDHDGNYEAALQRCQQIAAENWAQLKTLVAELS